MKVDRTAQAAATQAANEQQQGASGQNGFAGGSHRGTTYRHAPRAHPPSRRNTGPAKHRPRPRPPQAGGAGGHPEEHHAIPHDDPRNGPDGNARPLAATNGNPQQNNTTLRQDPESVTAPARAPRPPPSPKVEDGPATLRRSRLPAATLLLSRPPPGGTPERELFPAMASIYFGGSGTATRLAALAAAAKHVAEAGEPVTLDRIKGALLEWVQTNGPVPAATERQRDDNLLFPVYALSALRARPAAAQASADLRNDMLQRATTPPSFREPSP